MGAHVLCRPVADRPYFEIDACARRRSRRWRAERSFEHRGVSGFNPDRRVTKRVKQSHAARLEVFDVSGDEDEIVNPRSRGEG